MFKVLPADEQTLQLWAQQLPGVYDAQNSETGWSKSISRSGWPRRKPALWGRFPSSFSQVRWRIQDGDSDVPAAQLEKERKEGQTKLLLLSSNSRKMIVHSGHNMNLEKPDDVAAAIRDVVMAVRKHGKV